MKRFSNKWIGSIAVFLMMMAVSSFHQEQKATDTIVNSKQLGKKLFFDPILSKDKSISCASCHNPAFAFADTVAFSKGVAGKLSKRNAPSCMNLSDREIFFYDGRAGTLEEQVQFPIEDANEMNLPITEAVKRLKEDKTYMALFQKIYQSIPTEKLLKSSIADFERTLETSNTKFDKYMQTDSNVYSASEVRGRELFMSDKAKCFDCHFSPDFTGDEFRNIGLYDGKALDDKGRYEVTKDPKDLGKFKVPGLRNVSVTAPYMHNGMFKTLKEVIDYYDEPTKFVSHPINQDSLLMKPLHLTAQEKVDLENFLLTLTDKRFLK
jgi:cytochrome c peroxidase